MLTNLLWLACALLCFFIFCYLGTFAIQIYEGQYADIAARRSLRAATIGVVLVALIVLLALVLGLIHTQVHW